ncbi:MAG: DUF4258 domain-containing protein [Nitrospirae bacterium]|nr:DUF4258 domain-containing protein [Nitrospirota bacterium]
MKWREITEEEVENTLLHPEIVVDSFKGRKNVLKHIGKKYLKVTFAQKGDQMVIVTAVDKNR